MKKNAFTLIELLAVIVILAIIALIATPIILGIINDSKEKSNERSIEMYASAVKTSVAHHQLLNNESITGKYTTSDGKILNGDVILIVEYNGDVICDTIVIFKDGNIYLNNCRVNGEDVEYIYGKENIPESVSFSTDSWETIVTNVQIGNFSKYKVGDTKEVSLTDFTNTAKEKGTFTVRIANISSDDSICKEEGYSQTACGFVIEFVDIITEHNMNSRETNIGGWKDSEIRTYINKTIYDSLQIDLKENIIDTKVISGHDTLESKIYETMDKLYLLSAKEIKGQDLPSNELTNNTANSRTRQLDYYKDQYELTNNYLSTIKKYNENKKYWWLRSVGDLYSTVFNATDNLGNIGINFATDKRGVAPAFRIG